MKKIVEYRALLDVTKTATLKELKTIYRNCMKDIHPDTIENPEERLEAEQKSVAIIEAYHFLVSISKETHLADAAEYTATTTTSGIDDYQYKNLILKITFQNGSSYEYFGVPKSVYNKMSNASTLARFARRHIFHSFVYRNISQAVVAK